MGEFPRLSPHPEPDGVVNRVLVEVGKNQVGAYREPVVNLELKGGVKVYFGVKIFNLSGNFNHLSEKYESFTNRSGSLNRTRSCACRIFPTKCCFAGLFCCSKYRM